MQEVQLPGTASTQYSVAALLVPDRLRGLSAPNDLTRIEGFSLHVGEGKMQLTRVVNVPS